MKKRLHLLIKIIKKVSLRTYFQIAGVLVVVLIVALIIKAHTPRPGTVAFTHEYKVSLFDYSGHEVRFDSFTQKALVVFFWASWCPYCKAELTHLGELKAQYGDKIQILAVNRGESLSDAKTFSDSLLLPPGVLLLLDPNDGLFKQLQGYAVPETIFVNSRGEQVVHQRGPMKPEEADQAIQKILQ